MHDAPQNPTIYQVSSALGEVPWSVGYVVMGAAEGAHVAGIALRTPDGCVTLYLGEGRIRVLTPAELAVPPDAFPCGNLQHALDELRSRDPERYPAGLSLHWADPREVLGAATARNPADS